MVENSLFFSIRILPTFTLETKSPFQTEIKNKSLLIDDKYKSLGRAFRNK